MGNLIFSRIMAKPRRICTSYSVNGLSVEVTLPDRCKKGISDLRLDSEVNGPAFVARFVVSFGQLFFSIKSFVSCF